MPTDVAIGQRRKAALGRIVAALGGQAFELPRYPQLNPNMRQLKQIEFLADYIEATALQLAIPEKYIQAEQLARSNATKKAIVEALLEDADG